MEVTVIGSSISWTDRPASCYALGKDILIDCGEGTSKYLEKNGIDFLKVKHIFITHIHSDHCVSLLQFLCQHIQYNPAEKYKTLTIYGPKNFKKFLTDMASLFKVLFENDDIEKYINIVEIDDFSKTIEIDGYTVTMHELKHGRLVDIGYVFNDGKTKFGFSGDCTYTPNLDNFVNECDVMFLECCGESTTENHLGYDWYSKFQNENLDKTFFAIHCINKVFFNAEELKINVVDTGDRIVIENNKITKNGKNIIKNM